MNKLLVSKYAMIRNYETILHNLKLTFDIYTLDKIGDNVPDLVFFDGGSDISPNFYKEDNTYSHPNIPRDNHELEMFYKFPTAKKSGICRGHQLLNVLYGGTLFQDIKKDMGIDHSSHTAYITRSKFLSFLGRSIIPINSMHHQSVKKVGNGLIISAIAPDNIIEGIESTMVRAVQFHPEFMNGDTGFNTLRYLFWEDLFGAEDVAEDMKLLPALLQTNNDSTLKGD